MTAGSLKKRLLAMVLASLTAVVLPWAPLGLAEEISFLVEYSHISCTLGSLVPQKGESHAEVWGEAKFPPENKSGGTSFSVSPASYSYQGYWLEEMTSQAAYDPAGNTGSMSGRLSAKAPEMSPYIGGYAKERSIAILGLIFNVTDSGFYRVNLQADYYYQTALDSDGGNYFQRVYWHSGISLFSPAITPGSHFGGKGICMEILTDPPRCDYQSEGQTGRVETTSGPYYLSPGELILFVEMAAYQTGEVGVYTPVPVPAGFILLASGCLGLLFWRGSRRV